MDANELAKGEAMLDQAMAEFDAILATITAEQLIALHHVLKTEDVASLRFPGFRKVVFAAAMMGLTQAAARNIRKELEGGD